MPDLETIREQADNVLKQFYKGKKLEKMRAELDKTMEGLKKGKVPEDKHEKAD